MTDGCDGISHVDVTASAPERATEQIALKFTRAELADIDRVAMRRGVKRAVLIKAMMRAVVKRIDQEGAEHGTAGSSSASA